MRDYLNLENSMFMPRVVSYPGGICDAVLPNCVWPHFCRGGSKDRQINMGMGRVLKVDND